MVSKLVVDRDKSSRSVQAIAEAQLPVISKGIGAYLAPVLKDGEEVPDVETLIRLFLRRLAGDTDGMKAADSLDAQEDADLGAARSEHDKASEALRNALVETREVATAVVGTGGAKLLGFDGPTPSVPIAMETLAGTVATRLRDEARRPEPRSPKISWDPPAIAADLDAAREARAASAKNVREEERQGQVSQDDKDQAIERYDDSFRRAAGLITTLFEVAGHDALADKVRPSRVRPGRTDVEPEVPEA